MRKYLVAAVIAMTALALGYSPHAVYASGCSGADEGVFWSGPSNVYGSRSEMFLNNQTLDSSCAVGTNAAGSTAHLILGNTYGNWVEAGWQEELASNGTHLFQPFAEWGLNYVSQARNTYSAACLTPGAYQRWEDVNIPGTNNWNTWFDCEDGAGWRFMTKYSNTTYWYGAWAGETFRRGSNTTMNDIHRNAQWQDATNAWNYTTNLVCQNDAVSGWQGQLVTGSRYDTVTGSGGC